MTSMLRSEATAIASVVRWIDANDTMKIGLSKHRVDWFKIDSTYDDSRSATLRGLVISDYDDAVGTLVAKLKISSCADAELIHFTMEA